MKSGMVSLVGRPNVGKSTLLNQLLETKLAITSDKAQTTRNIIEGIYNDEDTQIVFIDTPGIHKPKYKLGNVLNGKAYNSTTSADLVLFLIDAESGFGRGDQFILDKLKELDVPIILILNKVDKMKKELLLKTIDMTKDLYNFAEIIPVSALKGDNVLHLISVIKKYLPGTEKIYDDSTVTNISNFFYISEIVREKVLRLTKEEVPHAVTCLVENFEEDEKLVHIQVLIIVDRDNLKKIIIGKNGSMLKEIGTYAREDLETYFGKKVFLETYVRTINNWRDREKYLLEFGLKEE
ncbi:MAG: GTPase Era [Bacilli bacterium]